MFPASTSHRRRTVRDMPDHAPPVLNQRTRTEKLGISVRCQNSNFMIGPEHEAEAGSWVCPGFVGCLGGEVYSEIRDYRLAWIPKIFDLLDATLGPPLGCADPTLFLVGVYAESALQYTGVHLVYLFPDRNGWQYAQQMGHESFHRWATPTATHHWTHEVLGEVFKLKCLGVLGMPGFVDQFVIPHAEEHATRLTVEEMMSVSVRDFPDAPALYARALLTGLALEDAVGEPALWRLASLFDNAGEPDVDGWIRSLPAGHAARVSTILGIEVEIDVTEPEVDLVAEELSDAVEPVDAEHTQ